MGYGVFPFALEKGCIIAVSMEKDQKYINISHTDSNTYPS